MVKILKTLFIILFIGILSFLALRDYFPQRSAASYFQELKKTAIISGDISQFQITEKQNTCYKDDENCFRGFFEQLTKYKGVAYAFSFLQYMMQKNEDYIDNCHQSTHGIGHGDYYNNGSDMGKTLNNFDANKYMKNMSTCGNGFFHGVVESAVEGIKDKDLLVKKFQNICFDPKNQKVLGTDCYHGLGHASLIQLDGNINSALYVCNNVIPENVDKFNCYTGVFMQDNMFGGVENFLKKDGGKFIFVKCDALSDALQKRACYFETALKFRAYSKNRDDYAEVKSYCLTISDPLLRLSCVKNVSIRSIIDSNYQDVNSMCLQNGFSDTEKIYCTAVFAHKLSLAINGTKKDTYYKYANDMCNILSITNARKCKNIILNESRHLYYTDENDFEYTK